VVCTRGRSAPEHRGALACRSTFYTHYRSKDELFLSELEDFLEAMSTRLLRSREASNRVAPVRELFAHVAEMRQLHAALVAAD